MKTTKTNTYKTGTLLALSGACLWAAGAVDAANLTAYYDFEGAGADRFDDPAGAFADNLAGGQASFVGSADTPGGFAGTQSVSFDGSYTLSTDAYTTDLGPDPNAYTIMYWIKARDIEQENDNTRLMSTGKDASGNMYWQVEGFGDPITKTAPHGAKGDAMDIRLQSKPGAFSNWFTNDATNALAREDQGETTAVWRHVAFILSNTGNPNDGGAYSRTFVDGVQVGGIHDPGTDWDGFAIGNTAGRLTIGGPDTGNGSRDFTGLLDDVALFAGAVSDADIAAIANGTLSPGAFVPEPTSLALLAMGGLLMSRRRRA